MPLLPALLPALSAFVSLVQPAPAAASLPAVLGLHSAPLHLTLAVDMTGSSKNPAFQYAPQARLIAQNVLLNQVRSGDSVTLLQVCNSVKTVADFTLSGKDARLSRADILRYSRALTEPCKGRGSAITTGFALATTAAARTPSAQNVLVYFTDGAVLDDPQRAKLGATFSQLLSQRNFKVAFLAGLSPETGGPGSGSVRDSFTAQLGSGASDKRVILAGAYDLKNVYPSFAAAVKAARQ